MSHAKSPILEIYPLELLVSLPLWCMGLKSVKEMKDIANLLFSTTILYGNVDRLDVTQIEASVKSLTLLKGQPFTGRSRC
jgi:hypothetical protein